MFTLYHGAVAASSLKCLLALAEKSLTFQSRYLDLAKFEQHEPWFVALNPEGQVPVLEHDGRVISDSSAINEYLEDIVTGAARLRPLDPYQTALMRRWNRYIDEHVMESVSMHGWNLFMGQITRAIEPDRFEALIQRIPLARQRAKWRASREGFAPASLAGALEKLIEAGAAIEKQLTKTAWLAGSDYTLADVNLYAVAGRDLPLLFPDMFTQERYPRLFEWMARMSARPAVTAASEVKLNEINF